MRTINRFFCNGVVDVIDAPTTTTTAAAAAGNNEAGGGGTDLPPSPPLDSLSAGAANPPASTPLPRQYARLVVEGRSFMMHQIRKMVRGHGRGCSPAPPSLGVGPPSLWSPAS